MPPARPIEGPPPRSCCCEKSPAVAAKSEKVVAESALPLPGIPSTCTPFSHPASRWRAEPAAHQSPPLFLLQCVWRC
jgi:hypothetical protein